MRSFVVGKVLEPELRATAKQGLVEFGLLLGRESVVLTVWDSDKPYKFACGLRDGQRVICILNSAVDSKGRLRYYVNDIALSPDGLREDLLELFKLQEQPARVAIPEPPKKAGA